MCFPVQISNIMLPCRLILFNSRCNPVYDLLELADQTELMSFSSIIILLREHQRKCSCMTRKKVQSDVMRNASEYKENQTHFISHKMLFKGA